MFTGSMMMSGGIGGNDSYTKLLLHADGTGQTFTDSSGSAHTMTANGDATQSLTQKKFGGKSAYFDGAGDYLSALDSADWDFGSGEFTIDLWVWFNAASTTSAFVYQYDNSSYTNSAIFFYYSPLNLLKLDFSYNSGTMASKSFSWTPSTGQWYHVALVRTGNNLMAFINGTQIGITEAFNYTIDNSTRNFYIGAGEFNNVVDRYYLNGYIDELRISKGIARWTANFTPPTEPYSP